MGRELGRISGPLLADNLRRNGSNLAFDNKVLFLDVVNKRIGFNSATPVTDLYTPTAIDTIDLIVDTTADIGNFIVSGSTIQHVLSNITISPNQTSNPSIITPGISTSNLYLYSNLISNTITNDNINFTANGTGKINLSNGNGTVQLTVTGNLHATGDITWDGNITFGNEPTDTVTFDAEVKSNMLPSANNVDSLGSNPATGGHAWKTVYINTVNTSSINTASLSTNSFTGSGINNLNGDTIIGTTGANTLTVTAEISSNLIPIANNTYNLGSSSKLWTPAYFNSFTDGNILINSNSITTTVLNSDLQLVANGNGKVVLSGLNVTHNAIIGSTLGVTNTTTLTNTTVGSVTQTGSYDITGNATLGNITNVGNITAADPLILPAVTINNTTITGTASGNNLKLTAYAGQHVEITSAVIFDNNVDITGTLGVTNTTALKNTNVGTVTRVGNFIQSGNTAITGNVKATGTITYSGANRNFGNFNISGHAITGTILDGTVYYLANGTGNVWLGNDIKINGNSIVNNFGYSSTTLFSEDSQILISEDGIVYSIETPPVSALDNSLLLNPTGSGSIVINTTNSLILPINNNSNFILVNPGQVRFNNVNLNIEGYSNTGYVNFIDLYSQDHKTFITGELTPGASDNTLRFAVNNTITTTITPTALTNSNLVAGNIDFTESTIANTMPSNALTINTSGTGVVNFNGINYVNNNTVNIPNNGALTIANTSNGYTQFTGTAGIVIPIGTNNQYPVTPVEGEIRYNTDLQYSEVYTGTEWQPIGGTSATLTTDEVADEMWRWDIILG